jgi:hypothetical protein
VKLHVDTSFDRAIQTDARLAFMYERAPSKRQLLEHAAQLMRSVDAEEAVLFELQRSRVQLFRAGVDAQELGHVSLTWPSASTNGDIENLDLKAALERLFEGQVEDDQRGDTPERATDQFRAIPSSPTAAEADHSYSGADKATQERPGPVVPGNRATAATQEPPSTTGSTTAASSRRRRRLALAGVTAGLGAASFAAAGLLNRMRDRRGQDVLNASPGTSEYIDAAAGWNSRRLAPYVFAAAGGSLSAAAMLGFAVLARHPPRAWISAVGAGVGVALLSWGVADIVGGGQCDPQLDISGCVAKRDRRDRGGLVAMSAFPLLSLPLALWARKARDTQRLREPSLAFDKVVSSEGIDVRVRFSARY